MDRSEREKRQLSEGFVICRQQLSESSKNVRRVLEFDRYRHSLRKSIGENIYAWMTCSGILGWVLSRIPAKKEKIYVLPHEQSRHLREQKIRKRNRKAKSKILSSVVELVLAVSLKLLGQQLKFWSSSLMEKNPAPIETLASRHSSKTERETLAAPFDRSQKTSADTHRASKAKGPGLVSLFPKDHRGMDTRQMSAAGRSIGLLHYFFISPTGIGAFGRIWTNLWRE